MPGDIILIEEGDTIPADARLIHSVALETAEAALTGESTPVSKYTETIPEEVELGDQRNMLFSGTAVTFGRGRAVVVATGMQTQMGHIAGMLEETPQEATSLQKELAHVGKLLGIIVVVIAVVMIATIILVEHVSGFAAIVDALILGVALAVAAIPGGTAGGRHRRLVPRRAADGAQERDRPASSGGGNTGLRHVGCFG